MFKVKQELKELKLAIEAMQIYGNSEFVAGALHILADMKEIAKEAKGDLKKFKEKNKLIDGDIEFMKISGENEKFIEGAQWAFNDMNDALS